MATEDCTAMRRCVRCEMNKAAECFGVRKNRNGAPRSHCKGCEAELACERRRREPDKAKAAWRKHAAANRDKRLAADKAYNEANPERRAECRRKSRERCRDRDREYQRQYCARTRAADPILRVRYRVSNYIRECLRGNKAGRGWESIVGYTLDDLKAHLERQFVKGMGWHNIADWHIDHIVPLSSFTISGPDDPELRRAWALPNLRPLWAKDNLIKGRRIVSLL